MEDLTTYCQQIEKISDSINNELLPIIHEKQSISIEINYVTCEMKLLNDDFGTVWVKWGQHNSDWHKLPLQTKAIIADNILRTIKYTSSC